MSNGKPKLEEVFKVSGIPTHTFIAPRKYTEILVSIRTPGRSLVIEGPSGIGKTTAITNALKELGIDEKVTTFSARRPEDIEYINVIPEMEGVGTVLVDDFHRLPSGIQSRLADHLKVLADREDKRTKIIILGINRAGDKLIHFAPDLVNRIDIVRFETEPDEKVEKLIKKGEDALKIEIGLTKEIVEEVRGSFYLTQMLCREICLEAGIIEQSDQKSDLDVSFEFIKANVFDRLGLAFGERCEIFCRGKNPRPEGRAPYLHILKWLADAETWTLNIRDATRKHAELRGSVGQVADKGFLKDLIESNEDIRAVLHFDGQLLTAEDPQFLFYIRNIAWRQFSRKLGYLAVDFERRYDFALSFAGTDRDLAESLFQKLTESEVEVFYDKNEEHRILAEDVEAYLRPIYQTEAQFIIVLLGRDYPKRIWTKMESEAFKDRIKDGSVIPVWFADVDDSMFDTTRARGGLVFDRGKDFHAQIASLTTSLLGKLKETR